MPVSLFSSRPRPRTAARSNGPIGISIFVGKTAGLRIRRRTLCAPFAEEALQGGAAGKPPDAVSERAIDGDPCLAGRVGYRSCPHSGPLAGAGIVGISPFQDLRF